MHQYITHIYDIAPRYFRMIISKFYRKKICSFSDNHDIIDNSMKAHNICFHILECLPLEVVINVFYTFVNMAKTVDVSNCFSHK